MLPLQLTDLVAGVTVVSKYEEQSAVWVGEFVARTAKRALVLVSRSRVKTKSYSPRRQLLALQTKGVVVVAVAALARAQKAPKTSICIAITAKGNPQAKRPLRNLSPPQRGKAGKQYKKRVATRKALKSTAQQAHGL